jgi:hypothetical protein
MIIIIMFLTIYSDYFMSHLRDYFRNFAEVVNTNNSITKVYTFIVKPVFIM